MRHCQDLAQTDENPHPTTPLRTKTADGLTDCSPVRLSVPRYRSPKKLENSVAVDLDFFARLSNQVFKVPITSEATKTPNSIDEHSITSRVSCPSETSTTKHNYLTDLFRLFLVYNDQHKRRDDEGGDVTVRPIAIKTVDAGRSGNITRAGVVDNANCSGISIAMLFHCTILLSKIKMEQPIQPPCVSRPLFSTDTTTRTNKILFALGELCP